MTKYGAILIDPPWGFKTYTEDEAIPQRAKEPHYLGLPHHKIAGLDVPEMAAKNCALFMWTVDCHLVEAMSIIDTWGFKYKTIAFIWVKLKDNQLDLYDTPPARIGMGYWTRKQAEICLLATRGRPAVKSRAVRQIINAPRREHSRKPDETYDRVEALVDGPYLELFARQRRSGWDAWGNEVDKFSPTKISQPTTNQEKFGRGGRKAVAT